MADEFNSAEHQLSQLASLYGAPSGVYQAAAPAEAGVEVDMMLIKHEALQDAVTTLDVWLAAYGTKSDTAIAVPDHDDDLLTFGHLRTISAFFTTAAGKPS